jgi:hypothetical protein
MRIQSEGALAGGKMLRSLVRVARTKVATFRGFSSFARSRGTSNVRPQQHPHWHVRKQPMARSNLKIYRGPAEKQAPVRSANKSQPATVTVELSEVLPLLADAVASRRTWLSDFEADQITISADLYEVLLAYQYYRHPAA